MGNNFPDIDAVFRRIPLLQSFRVVDFKVSQLAGFTNYNFHLKSAAHDLVLRIPKKETNQFINRAFEADNVEATSQFGFTPEVLWRDESGLSLTKNCSLARPFNFDDMRNQSILISLIANIAHLHKSNIQFSGEIEIAELVTQYFSLIPESSVVKLNSHYESAQKKLSLIAKVDARKVPSHNDLVLGNLLIQPDHRIWIIDWEYSAPASPYWDLATLCNSARYDLEQNLFLLELYNAHDTGLDEQILRDYQIILQLLTVCWIAKFSSQQLDAELDWLLEIES